MNAHRLDWVPGFVAGFVALLAAEVSSGLLLYSGVGLFQSFTLLLAVILGSLSVGVWSSPVEEDEDAVEGVRKRWMLALVAYSIAAVTAGVWEYRGGLNAEGLTRGLGLALLAGFPLYSVGALLGSIGLLSHDGRRVAAFSLAGAATGAVLMGVVLVSSLIPVSLFGFCLVALAGAAMIHGKILDTRVERRAVDEVDTLHGRVRVEDHLWGARRVSQRHLTVDERLLGGTDDGRALRLWEAALSERLVGEVEPVRILCLGASATALIRSQMEGGHQLVVVEPNSVVRQMTVRHFGVALHDENLTWVECDQLQDLPADLVGFDVVVLDGASWWSHSIPLPPASVLRLLRGTVSEAGVLFVGGEDPSALMTGGAEVLSERAHAAGWEGWSVFRGVDRAAPGSGLLAFGSSHGIPQDLTGMKNLGHSTKRVRDEAPHALAPEAGS